MPVNDRDPQWAKFNETRAKVSDLFEGRESAITHIHPLPGWDADTLAGIAELAYFLPIVARTAETFGGLVFQKAPQRIGIPESLKPYLNDVTQTGQEIDRFAEQALDGVMLTGSILVLTDYPASDVPMTKAEAEKIGRRPVLRLYDGDSILAARKTLIQGVLKLTHVRLLETAEVPDGDDGFAVRIENRVRVLDLKDGVYTQTLWTEGQDGWVAGETITPQMDGKALDHIPADFSNTRDGEARAAKPPLADLADISIAHLNNSAQYEWALAWLGSPMLFGAGITLAEGETIQMGASSAVMAPEASAKLEIVQADGAKFSGLKTAMDDKRRDAAANGARMLLEATRQAVTAETSRNERAGEASVVVSMANAVSQCLTNAIRRLARWAQVSGAEEAEYWLSQNLLPAKLDAQQVTAYLNAWLKGALTKAELFALFQEGELIDPSKTLEEHEDEQIEEAPDPADAADIEAALGADPARLDPPVEEA